MAQIHVLSNVSWWVGRSENLIDPSESPWNEDAKIGIGLISRSNTSRENEKNVFTKNPWIHNIDAICILELTFINIDAIIIFVKYLFSPHDVKFHLKYCIPFWEGMVSILYAKVCRNANCNFLLNFFKNTLLYISCRLSKIRSVHMHVMPWAVYFGWICI